MNHKITLTYENGQFDISINNKSVNQETDIEVAFETFKQVIKNNAGHPNGSWEAVEELVKTAGDPRFEINSDYKTVQIGSMKYFYNTGKVFYMGQGKMVALTGGYDFFEFILKLVASGLVEEPESLLYLCMHIVESSATYGLSESELSVASAAFSYGNVSYNFATGKMNKGTSSEKVDFEKFKAFVVDIIK